MNDGICEKCGRKYRRNKKCFEKHLKSCDGTKRRGSKRKQTKDHPVKAPADRGIKFNEPAPEVKITNTETVQAVNTINETNIDESLYYYFEQVPMDMGGYQIPQDPTKPAQSVQSEPCTQANVSEYNFSGVVSANPAHEVPLGGLGEYRPERNPWNWSHNQVPPFVNLKRLE